MVHPHHEYRVESDKKNDFHCFVGIATTATTTRHRHTAVQHHAVRVWRTTHADFVPEVRHRAVRRPSEARVSAVTSRLRASSMGLQNWSHRMTTGLTTAEIAVTMSLGALLHRKPSLSISLSLSPTHPHTRTQRHLYRYFSFSSFRGQTTSSLDEDDEFYPVTDVDLIYPPPNVLIVLLPCCPLGLLCST